MERAEAEKKTIVRLHTGDPSLYGAIREQMDRLEEMGIAYDVCPGVSSFNGAAASLGAELTHPGGVPDGDHHPRMAGRTGCAGAGELPVPWRPTTATMAVFLSAGTAGRRWRQELAEAGYRAGHSGGDRLQGHMAGGERPSAARSRRLGEVARSGNGIREDGHAPHSRRRAGDQREANGYAESRLYAPDFYHRNSERGRTHEEAVQWWAWGRETTTP